VHNSGKLNRLCVQMNMRSSGPGGPGKTQPGNSQHNQRKRQPHDPRFGQGALRRHPDARHRDQAGNAENTQHKTGQRMFPTRLLLIMIPHSCLLRRGLPAQDRLHARNSLFSDFDQVTAVPAPSRGMFGAGLWRRVQDPRGCLIPWPIRVYGALLSRIDFTAQSLVGRSGRNQDLSYEMRQNRKRSAHAAIRACFYLAPGFVQRAG